MVLSMTVSPQVVVEIGGTITIMVILAETRHYREICTKTAASQTQMIATREEGLTTPVIIWQTSGTAPQVGKGILDPKTTIIS